MATFRQADDAILARITELVKHNHHQLAEAGVTFGCLMAFPPRDKRTDEPTGPALKKDGLAVPGQVKIVSHRDRVAGKQNVEIALDGELWGEWDADQQDALLDHLLQSLEVAYDDEGNIKLDDSCHPKLKKRPVDWRSEGFEVIARRHGTASLEVRTFTDTRDRYGAVLQG